MNREDPIGIHLSNCFCCHPSCWQRHSQAYWTSSFNIQETWAMHMCRKGASPPYKSPALLMLEAVRDSCGSGVPSWVPIIPLSVLLDFFLPFAADAFADTRPISRCGCGKLIQTALPDLGNNHFKKFLILCHSWWIFSY